MLRIHLFGNPKILDDEQSVPLPTPDKAFELWAYLLLERQQPIPRNRVAYQLWPDVPEDEARANLRRHLHLLRRQLPESPSETPWFVSQRNTLQWNPDAAYWLDVAFVESFDETSYDEALWAELQDCYRGDLLEGTYEDWALAAREHLHRRFTDLLETWLSRQRARGDLAGSIRTTQRLLAHDPLREEPYRYLMELYYQAGDRAAALREFEKCETMLRTELDATPMPETLALRDAILQDHALPALPRPAPPQRTLQVQEPSVPGPERVPEKRLVPPPLRWRWLGLLAIVVLALALGAAVAVAILNLLNREPETISISGPAAVQDTWLNFAYPDLPYDPKGEPDPYAVYPQVHLSYWNYPYDRVLVRFDLDQLPPGAEVEQAIFRIHLVAFINEDLLEPRPATLSAYCLLRPWEPETVTFNAPWSQPGLAPGLDYEGRPFPGQAIYDTDWVSIDVTEAVRAWLEHPDENWGLMLMISEAPQGAHYWVDTADYPLANRQPRLDVTYLP